MAWASSASGTGGLWTPFTRVVDAWDGVDFVPIASTTAACRASTDRPIVTWAVATITASAFTAERQP